MNYVSKSAGERLARQKVPVPETAFQQQISVLFVSTYRKLVNGIVAMFVKGLEPYAARNNLVFTHYGINSNPATCFEQSAKVIVNAQNQTVNVFNENNRIEI